MEDPFQVDELGLPLFLGNPHIWMCSWDLAGLILAWYLVNMWLIFVYFWLIFGEYVADICSFVVEFGEYVADICLFLVDIWWICGWNVFICGWIWWICGLYVFMCGWIWWICGWYLFIFGWYLVNMWLDICSFVVEFGEYVADIGEDLMKKQSRNYDPITPICTAQVVYYSLAP